MTKVYKLTNDINLTTTISFNGKARIICFTGGSIGVNANNQVVNGTFVTDDYQTQSAIEQDQDYGTKFILVGGTVNKQCEEENTVKPTETGLTEVKGVKSKQVAIDWLSANKNIELPVTMLAADVQAQACDVGIVFVDWK